MRYYALNDARSTLAAALGNNPVTDRTVYLANNGARFDLGSSGEYYTFIHLEDAAGNIEIVKLLDRPTGNTLTNVDRAQDGTSIRTWNIGDIVECRPCAGAINDIQAISVNGIVTGDGSGNLHAATAAEVVAVIGATAVQNATSAGTAASATIAATAAAQDWGTNSTAAANTAYVDRLRTVPAADAGAAVVPADIGKCKSVSADVTIANSVMAANDVVSIYNDSDIPITIISSLTFLRMAGTSFTGNRVLAGRGLATIWFKSPTEAVISGAGLT